MIGTAAWVAGIVIMPIAVVAVPALIGSGWRERRKKEYGARTIRVAYHTGDLPSVPPKKEILLFLTNNDLIVEYKRRPKAFIPLHRITALVDVPRTDLMRRKEEVDLQAGTFRGDKLGELVRLVDQTAGPAIFRSARRFILLNYEEDGVVKAASFGGHELPEREPLEDFFNEIKEAVERSKR